MRGDAKPGEDAVELREIQAGVPTTVVRAETRRRLARVAPIPVSKPSGESLPRLADALGVSSDYLMAETTGEAAKNRFGDREFLRQFQEVESLLDALLTKKQVQRLAG